MITRAWELLLSLLNRPSYQTIPVAREVACRVLHDATEGEKLLRILASQSPIRAREVLSWSEKSLDYWEYQNRLSVIDAVEEQLEGEAISVLTDDELQARATLHVLMPPDGEGMPRRGRVLAIGLEKRHPELAASVLLHHAIDDNFADADEPIRRRVMLRLQDSHPTLAVRLISAVREGIDWLQKLLTEPEKSAPDFAGMLLEYTLKHWQIYSIPWDALQQLVEQAIQQFGVPPATYLDPLLNRLMREPTARRSLSACKLLSICGTLPDSEKRRVGELLRNKISQNLSRIERRVFLRHLAHWLRPALTGPEDRLAQLLQADRASALLIHLSPPRLARARLWMPALAPSYQRHFLKNWNRLWGQYLERRKLIRELVATLDTIAKQKSAP